MTRLYQSRDFNITFSNVAFAIGFLRLIQSTDKVFTENGREKGDAAFTGMLEKLLESEIIFIPWHKINDDVFGHSDGIVKYACDGRVLMSNIAQDDEGKDLAKGIRRELERKGLDVVELHFDEKDPAFTYSWAYINFIQVGN
jgi:agmatine deiminase